MLKQKYYLTGGILFVLLALCIAKTTFPDHNRNEQADFMDAEKKLGDARWEASEARDDYLEANIYYSTVNSEWNSNIQSLTRSTLSILSIDPIAAARNSLFSVSDWFSHIGKSNERQDALYRKNTAYAAWDTAKKAIGPLETARDIAYKEWRDTFEQCDGGCGLVEHSDDHYVGTPHECGHIYEYSCQDDNHYQVVCNVPFTYDDTYINGSETLNISGIAKACGKTYWECLAGSSHAVVKHDLCKHYYYACVGHDCPEETPGPCGHTYPDSDAAGHAAASCGLSGHYICDGLDHSLQASCSEATCNVTNFYACQSHTHSPGSGSGNNPPTDNTPNCQDCTSDCSSPCSCTNSGTCGGSSSGSCPANSWTNCDNTKSHATTCQNCTENPLYYTCSSTGVAYHTPTLSCIRAACSNTWSLCAPQAPDCNARPGNKCWNGT